MTATTVVADETVIIEEAVDVVGTVAVATVMAEDDLPLAPAHLHAVIPTNPPQIVDGTAREVLLDAVHHHREDATPLHTLADDQAHLLHHEDGLLRGHLVAVYRLHVPLHVADGIAPHRLHRNHVAIRPRLRSKEAAPSNFPTAYTRICLWLIRSLLLYPLDMGMILGLYDIRFPGLTAP